MKVPIRKKYKALRDNLSTDLLRTNSLAILNILTSLEVWHQAQRIMVYISFGGEVMTRPIIERSWALGKEVVIPVCQKERGMIVPSLLYSFDELEPKTMGILEPISDKLREVDPQSIDLCLVPGIAFDYYGNRIGFGAGYYDRFLPLLKPTAPKVALAHSFQLTVSPLPTNPNDIPVDFIITEKGKETPLLKK